MESEVRPNNRLFVALDPPTAVRDHLARLAAGLSADPAARAVPPENLHATLAFLGRADPSIATSILDEMRSAARGLAVRARVGALRGRPRSATRVIAAQLELVDPTATTRLRSLRAALRRLAGLSDDERPFWPHVTLVRFRRPTRVTNLPSAMGEHMFAFERLTLYDSLQRQSAPPRYVSVGAIDLATPAP